MLALVGGRKAGAQAPVAYQIVNLERRSACLMQRRVTPFSLSDSIHGVEDVEGQDP